MNISADTPPPAYQAHDDNSPPSNQSRGQQPMDTSMPPPPGPPPTVNIPMSDKYPPRKYNTFMHEHFYHKVIVYHSLLEVRNNCYLPNLGYVSINMPRTIMH